MVRFKSIEAQMSVNNDKVCSDLFLGGCAMLLQLLFKPQLNGDIMNLIDQEQKCILQYLQKRLQDFTSC